MVLAVASEGIDPNRAVRLLQHTLEDTDYYLFLQSAAGKKKLKALIRNRWVKIVEAVENGKYEMWPYI